MTKKALIEKWTKQRGKAAGEASKLNVRIAGLNQKIKRLAKYPENRGIAVRELDIAERQLLQIAARIVTIDAILKDV